MKKNQKCLTGEIMKPESKQERMKRINLELASYTHSCGIEVYDDLSIYNKEFLIDLYQKIRMELTRR